MYALFDGKYSRVTTDIDFLGRRISNRKEEMQTIFESILSYELNDGLLFDLEAIKVEEINEFKEYHGLRISTCAHLNRTRIPISVDIAFGDVISPKVVKRSFPTILDMPSPILNVYPLESIVAEKLETIVKNGFLNSRYKDFYDLYVLCKTYSFNYFELREAIDETFKNRGTVMGENIEAFSEEFVQDPVHLVRWKFFVKKKKAFTELSLEEVMVSIREFVEPLLETRTDLILWNPKLGSWEMA